jgi:hypothetical protein
VTRNNILDIPLESSAFDFELITTIPGKELVNTIWDFYQNMGHKKIRLEVLTSKRESRYIFHKPDFKNSDISIVQKITVFTNKRKNKQKFDAIEFRFEDLDSHKLKIKTSFMVLTPVWFYLWAVIDFGAIFYYKFLYYGSDRLMNLIAVAVTILLLIPGFLLAYFLMFSQIDKIKKYPHTARYKKELEEHIRLKEMFP